MLRGIVCGLGFGFFQSPNNRELIGSAPREKSASAAGLLAAIRVGGQTLGAALVAIVFGFFGAELAGAAGATTSSRAPRRRRSGWPARRPAPRRWPARCACCPRAPSGAGWRLREIQLGDRHDDASGYAATSAVRNFAASPTSTMVGAVAERPVRETRDRRRVHPAQRRGEPVQLVERQPVERVRSDRAHQAAGRLGGAGDPAQQRGAPGRQLGRARRGGAVERAERGQYHAERLGHLGVLHQRAGASCCRRKRPEAKTSSHRTRARA